MPFNQVLVQSMHAPLQNACRIIENGCVVAENLAIKVAHVFTYLTKISGVRNQIRLETLTTLNERISELWWILKDFSGALIISTSRVIDLSLFRSVLTMLRCHKSKKLLLKSLNSRESEMSSKKDQNRDKNGVRGQNPVNTAERHPIPQTYQIFRGWE